MNLLCVQEEWIQKFAIYIYNVHIYYEDQLIVYIYVNIKLLEYTLYMVYMCKYVSYI